MFTLSRSIFLTLCHGKRFRLLNTNTPPHIRSVPLLSAFVTLILLLTGPGLPTVQGQVVESPEAGTTLAVEEGTSSAATYRVKLDSPPTSSSTLTVTPTANPTGKTTISRTSLVFSTTNWNTYQHIRVSAANDLDDQDESVTITHTITGGDARSQISTVLIHVLDDAADTTSNFGTPTVPP